MDQARKTGLNAIASRAEILSFLKEGKLDQLVERGLSVDHSDDIDDPGLLGPDGELVDSWRTNYPYDQLLPRREYETEKRFLQIELLKAQTWMVEEKRRIVILFEGRDAAGKGGAIKRFTEHLNPRGARVVALGVPSEREKGQWYFQRYVAHLPTAGEIVMFDRSWYNRAVVEPVMGFCTDQQHDVFMDQVAPFEEMLIGADATLVKLWFSVTQDEQLTRFVVRGLDPIRQWKLSPMDIASLDRWKHYTEAKKSMFAKTHSDSAPWTVIQANDKKRGRLEALRCVLYQLDYPDKDVDRLGTPDPRIVGPPPTPSKS